MVFGQLVIGPPGAGKSTFCNGMSQFLRATGRKVALVNLDPANDVLPYEPDVDIRELVSIEGVAEQCGLGPNGALVWCIEFLEANTDWLIRRLDAPEISDAYVILDMPGQVELYTHHTAVRELVAALAKKNHRLTAVHLVDAHHCADPAKFISVLMVTLSAMVQLEMPQVNLLSKVDLIESYGHLDFGLDFYTDVLDPARLLPLLRCREGETPFARKHSKLNAAIAELIEDFSLVTFGTLDISDKASVRRCLRSIDKANGYCFGDSGGADGTIFTCAAGEIEWDAERLGDVQERYMTEADLHELAGPGSGAAGAAPGEVHERAPPIKPAREST